MPVLPVAKRHAFSLVVALLSLAGCANLAPPQKPVPLPVPDRYPQSLATEPTQAASLAWQQYFQDPLLKQWIEAALVHNRDLQLATLRLEEARAAFGIQRADRLPTIAASYIQIRSQTPSALSFAGPSSIVDLKLGSIGFSSWEVDFWGRVANLTEAARQNLLASNEARRAVSLSLIHQVATGYVTLIELRERLALARKTLSNREQSLNLFRRREAVGSASRLELTSVEGLVDQARSLVIQLEQAKALQENALRLLVGHEVNFEAVGERIDAGLVAGPLAPGLPSDLLLARPDLVAAEHALKAANANIGAARAAFFPRIALTTSLGGASSELNDLFSGANRTWVFMPSISLPIFTAGRLQASLDLAKIRKEEAVVRYEAAIQSAFRDVSDALAAEKWLTEQTAVLKSSLATANERARLSNLRYEHGAARYLEVLDAERDRLVVEQQYVQARRAQLSASIALYAALGGGSRMLPQSPFTSPENRRP